jgi:hypothetical protein
MDAARAGGHGERLEPEAAQEIADCASRRAHLGEALPGGVEVEDEPVRTLEAVGAASPHEGGDHALFREVDKRGRVVGGDVVDRPPSRLGTSTVAIQSGKCRGGLLHEVAIALYPLGEALEGPTDVRARAEPSRQPPRRSGGEVELGQPGLREELALGVAYLDLASPGGDLSGHSRLTSPAAVPIASGCPAQEPGRTVSVLPVFQISTDRRHRRS